MCMLTFNSFFLYYRPLKWFKMYKIIKVWRSQMKMILASNLVCTLEALVRCNKEILQRYIPMDVFFGHLSMACSPWSITTTFASSDEESFVIILLVLLSLRIKVATQTQVIQISSNTNLILFLSNINYI